MDWVNLTPKINNKFKFQLFGRTVDNLDKCYEQMGEFDPEKTGYLSPHYFNLFLNSFGVYLSTQEIRTVKEKFGQGDNIRFYDFLQNVRHDISQKRLAAIDHCFQQLQLDGVIYVGELLQLFDADNHTHSRCLMKAPQKIYAEFQQAIRRRSSDGTVLTYQDWKQYFLDVNACIPAEREQYYLDIMIHSFHLMDNRVTLDRLRQMEVTIYEKVRQKTNLKKDEGIKAEGGFRFFDMEDKGVVNYGRFVQTLERLGCKFVHKEMKALYLKHAGGDKLLTYEEMCGLLFEMGSGDKQNTNPIYEIAKKGQGYITSPGMTKQFK